MQERKIKNLVIACGHNCPMSHHPSERWLSIDPAPQRKADITKLFEETTSEDFKPFGVSKKFKAILVEVITDSLNAKQIQKINHLLEDQGALIVIAGDSNGLKKCIETGFEIESFIGTRVFSIFIKKQENIKNIIEIISRDLKFIYSKIGKNLQVIHQEIQRLQSEYKEMDPLLLSGLAHVRAYIIQRKQRTFRNYFKDDEYQNLLKEVETAFVNLDQKKMSAKDVLTKLAEWQTKLPSNTSPDYKLNYDTLARIFAICENVISYHRACLQLVCYAQKPVELAKIDYHPR